MEIIKSFIKEEDGLGTVEIVVIIAILIGIALLFKRQIYTFVANLLDSIFGSDQIQQITNDPSTTTSQ
ncbi:MAG: Flp1 family type IVb pilin [Bacillota bacterium]